MARNFITNKSDAKTVHTRIKQLINHSQELKFLVGFFYFSGIRELYESLKAQPDQTMKVLVGMQVENYLGHLAEMGVNESDESRQDKINQFFSSARKALNHPDLDNKDFYEQVGFFLEMLENDRLIIKKTAEPNHAKLYIFQLREGGQELTNQAFRFITGSSNLTTPGLKKQNEFNVEIGDYGGDDANEWFEELWENAVPITEIEQNKTDIITFIRNESQAALVEPFEAYAFILKTWLDIQQQKEIKPQVVRLMEEKGYKTYSYQLDAVNQALTIIENYNGLIIGDVVGLGKSIVASAIGKNLGKRGVVICPPGLIGDDKKETGWQKYLSDFELHDWEVRSVGKLEEVYDYLQEAGNDIEVIVVDEAHRFRNEDTEAYEWLSHICRNRTTILLTATPFSNTPNDIFSLLKLFIIPGQSGLTLEPNLAGQFREYNREFYKLSFIQKNVESPNQNNRYRALTYYQELFSENESTVNLALVRQRAGELANKIRKVIEPVMIRRNRIDLRKDHQYKKEIQALSNVKDPQEYFFELNDQQSAFYDQVISSYFGDGGRFMGAIYQPFFYDQPIDEEKMDEETNRVFQQQRNLYEFMKRLLVKRFESSFGAFQRSIKTFRRVHQMVLKFIEQSGGKFILDRDLMERIYTKGEDEIEQHLEEYARKLEENEKAPKYDRIYHVEDFTYEDQFIKDIEKDLKLFDDLIEQLGELDLVNNDPKLDALIHSLEDIIQSSNNDEPDRKVVIFTEYVDTVKHLGDPLENAFNNRVLVFKGNLTRSVAETINRNFDASVPAAKQKNDFDILLTTDKLAEGINLNRAGAIINYDIPWNPTKVIQRVGRINRIGQKVFEELQIYNLFPTRKGEDVVNSRKIARQKMYQIHNILGEDAKIFHPDEEPSESGMYNRLHENPEEQEEESLTTTLRNKYAEIETHHPDVIQKISRFPFRIKTAKESNNSEVIVLRKKGMGIFIQHVTEVDAKKPNVDQIFFDQAIDHIECEPETPRLSLSQDFWNAYDHAKSFRPKYKGDDGSTNSIKYQALNNLMTATKAYRQDMEEVIDFIETLIRDLRKYNTLPYYSLRRISQYDLSKANKKNISNFCHEIQKLKGKLGPNYLTQIEERAKMQQDEVIVGVENRRHNIKTE